MNNSPIGVFDSGMGGLTVMRALSERLPKESFLYLGDTARLPYGTKSADTVKRYALQASRALMQRGVKMVPGTGGGMTVQACITREMAEHNDVPLQNGCTSTQQKKSGNRMQFTFRCTNPPSSGEGEVSFTPDAYTSHTTVKTSVQGEMQTMTMDATGKWLSADCGSVKPVKPAK